MTEQIIDCITHISRNYDDVIGWGPRFLAEDLIEQMDAPRKVLGEPARIDKAIVFPALGDTVPTSKLSFEEQHAYVVESVAKYPDRLIGGIVVHARLWNDRVADYFFKLVREHNFRMLFIHPSLHKYWLPIQSPSEGEGSRELLYPLFEAAREAKLPVLIHTGEPPYALPATADFVAGQFPDVPMIIAHMGTQGLTHTMEAALLGKYHDNVYLETSYSQYHLLIEAVHSVGPERVIFGSNCPPNEPTQQLMYLEESLVHPAPIGTDLPVEDFQKILGANLAGLLAAVEPTDALA